MEAVDASAPHNAERRFYGLAALVAALIAFAGFARTYYLKGAFGSPALPGLVHLHGIVMTAWIVLFAVQASLVAARRVDLHRKLGIAGAALAALVVIVGVATAIEGARRGVTPGPWGAPSPRCASSWPTWERASRSPPSTTGAWWTW